MTTTTHTPATLRALHADDPRKLDALAAEVVMGQTVEWRNCYRDPESGGWNEVERWGDQGDGRQPCEVIHSVGYDYDSETDTLLDDGNHYWHTYFDAVPIYSASLDAAALLEQRLAERGLDENYAARLVSICTGDGLSHMEGIGISMECVTDYWAAFRFATATAMQRTIAAVLAAQGNDK